MKTGIFFGTCTGNTEELAEVIQEQLGLSSEDVHDEANTTVDDLLNYEFLIIGIPTWHIGELQDDWYGIYQELENIDMTGTDCEVTEWSTWSTCSARCGEGTHFRIPWLQTPHIFDVRIRPRNISSATGTKCRGSSWRSLASAWCRRATTR